MSYVYKSYTAHTSGATLAARRTWNSYYFNSRIYMCTYILYTRQTDIYIYIFHVYIRIKIQFVGKVSIEGSKIWKRVHICTSFVDRPCFMVHSLFVSSIRNKYYMCIDSSAHYIQFLFTKKINRYLFICVYKCVHHFDVTKIFRVRWLDRWLIGKCSDAHIFV